MQEMRINRLEKQYDMFIQCHKTDYDHRQRYGGLDYS